MVKGTKLTTEEYIIKAQEKWKNSFNYSKTNYVNAITNIIIICKLGHEFEYNPYNHISNDPNNKGGCDKCARMRTANIAKTKFLEKAKKKHGKTIDYSNFVWIGREKQNTFTCKIHTDFTQRIGDHLKTEFPCPQCREINRQKKLQEKYKKLTPEMIEKFKNIHPNKYSYEKYQYKGRKETSTITCNACCADFEQYTHNHLTGSGCPTCMSKNRGEKQKKTEKEFKEEVKIIHPTLDFNKFIYTTSKTQSKVYCKKHNYSWEATPNNLLRGAGCYHCGVEKNIENSIMNTEEYIKRADEKHNGLYIYPKDFIYTGTSNNITVICSEHGPFPTNAANHLYAGSGCPHCINTTEGKLYNWLKIYFPNLIESQFSPIWSINDTGRKKRYDFVIENIKLIIELDGKQHFEYISHWHQDNLNGHINQQESDIYKMKKANENGYSVIRLLTKDVREDKNNWENNLLAAIKPYDTSTNIFICSNDEYENHKRLMNN